MRIKTILGAAAFAGSLFAFGCEDAYDNTPTTGAVRSVPRATTPPPAPVTPAPEITPAPTPPVDTLPPAETPPPDTNPDKPAPEPTPPGTGGDSGPGTSPGH